MTEREKDSRELQDEHDLALNRMVQAFREMRGARQRTLAEVCLVKEEILQLKMENVRLREKLSGWDLEPEFSKYVTELERRILSTSMLVPDAHRSEVRRLARKLEEARGAIARAETDKETLRDAYKAASEREARLRCELLLVKTPAANVWRWMGDGSDEPESLVAPVIMSAEALRTLLAQIPKATTTGARSDGFGSRCEPCE